MLFVAYQSKALIWLTLSIKNSCPLPLFLTYPSVFATRVNNIFQFMVRDGVIV